MAPVESAGQRSEQGVPLFQELCTVSSNSTNSCTFRLNSLSSNDLPLKRPASQVGRSLSWVEPREYRITGILGFPDLVFPEKTCIPHGCGVPRSKIRSSASGLFPAQRELFGYEETERVISVRSDWSPWQTIRISSRSSTINMVLVFICLEMSKRIRSGSGGKARGSKSKHLFNVVRPGDLIRSIQTSRAAP